MIDGKLLMSNNHRPHIIDAVRDADTIVEILESGAVLPLIVTGSSMSPYLKDHRDAVNLRKTTCLVRGRILFFRRRNGEFILHRLRKILPDGRLLMNGDAQNWCETITRDQVLAEVISVTRNGRTIDPNGLPSKLWNVLWYPTRIFRPTIWKLRHVFCSFYR